MGWFWFFIFCFEMNFHVCKSLSPSAHIHCRSLAFLLFRLALSARLWSYLQSSELAIALLKGYRPPESLELRTDGSCWAWRVVEGEFEAWGTKNFFLIITYFSHRHHQIDLHYDAHMSLGPFTGKQVSSGFKKVGFCNCSSWRTSCNWHSRGQMM